MAESSVTEIDSATKNASHPRYRQIKNQCRAAETYRDGRLSTRIHLLEDGQMTALAR